MPAADARKDPEGAPEPGREVDREKDRERDKNGKTKGSGKTKDLSHVPCKFFRVGSCTAGPSCPFSHNILEPGQQKEVCAWFVKGNCKFGHKCALAHVLPGQSMSMDRKNKKAAQLASQAGGAGASGGREGGRRSQKSGAHGTGASGAPSRNGLLSGSTAPTRALAGNSRSGIPMPLKATLSPSTPAPPVKDTDFASFGLPDESNKLPSAPAQRRPPAAPAPDVSSTAPRSTQAEPVQIEVTAKMDASDSGPLPTSTPTAPRRVGNTHGSPPVDFGPIGSPPRSSESVGRPARVNGFSPGTSPNAAGISTSTFSAPGSRTVFAIQGDEDASSGYAGRSGLSASLGAMMTWSNDRPSRRNNGMGIGEVVVEDEDLEEFLPSSLTDLLTPEERSRRLSRTNGVRPNGLGADLDGATGGLKSTVDGQHHRYSRSVPAPSLLQDIKSIWADNSGAGTSEGLATPGTSVTGGGLGNGTPSSFTSSSGLAGRSGEDVLSPSNASAAFLPNLHHHYLNSKVQRPNLLGGGMSALHGSNVNGLNHSNLAGMHVTSLASGALSPPRTSALGNRPPMGSPSSDLFYGQQRHPATSGNDGALQAHAPGQSLPQGLAAGYSRIHALPPPVIASPSTPGAFSQGGGYSPGAKAFGHAQSPPGEWHGASPGAANAFDSLVHFTAQTSVAAGSNALGGLETVFSQLSYSASTTRGAQGTPGGGGVRNPSGRSYNAQGSLSPLSGPVLTGDDDDLFSMDG